MKLNKADFLSVYGADISDRDLKLLSSAYDVLKKNTFEGNYPWGQMPIISPWGGEDSGGLWNWDSAFHAVAASRFDTELAKNCITAFIAFQQPNGMLPDVIRASGNHELRLSKPPVLPWAAWRVFESDNDTVFLRSCYERFVKKEKFLKENRCYDGLFYYSSQENREEDNYLLARWESGWDNSPRWDKAIVELWPIDLNCYMVMFYRAMANTAAVLGEDSKQWETKADTLSRLIEKRLYDRENGYYCDVNRFSGEYSSTLSPASFMPLYIKIADRQRAEKMRNIAADRNKFFPGMPTVSYDHPEFGNDYWRGPTWLNVAYFAAKGLKNYGFDDTADNIKEYLLDMIYDNSEQGIFENYDSVGRRGLCCSCFSWSAAFVMEFILNWDDAE